MNIRQKAKIALELLREKDVQWERILHSVISAMEMGEKPSNAYLDASEVILAKIDPELAFPIERYIAWLERKNSK